MVLPFYSIYSQTDVESSPMTSTVLVSGDIEIKSFVSGSKNEITSWSDGLILEIE